MSDAATTSTEGYTYFTIYRNHSVYTKRVEGNYTYAAGDKERVWVFADSFKEIRKQLDEGQRPSTVPSDR